MIDLCIPRHEGLSNRVIIRLLAGLFLIPLFLFHSNSWVYSDESRPEDKLILQSDEKRPQEQFRILLLGRPLTLGGEYEITMDHKRGLNSENAEPGDSLNVDQELDLELFYKLRENTSLFLELKPFLDINSWSSEINREIESGLELSQAWIHFTALAGTSLEFQIGRQNFEDERQWWWDEDLDAIRLYYNQNNFNIELALAEQLLPRSTNDKRIKSEEKNILRFLGFIQREGLKGHILEFFLLLHKDHSHSESLGELANAGSEDENDANLTWMGLRLLGSREHRILGKFQYWLDTGAVWGRENLFEYIDLGDRTSRVASIIRSNVRGFGIDFGVTWLSRLKWSPWITLGYAYGSGDRDTGDNLDRSFRQPNLQDNKWRFMGVNSFQYYGEILQPELSNLNIFTVALGFPLLQNSSIEFLYHLYHQDHAVPSLGSSELDFKPNGLAKSIGQEFDLILGLQEWKRVEIEFASAVFQAGQAFGPPFNRTIWRMVFELAYNF